jgi:hypothetical protein
MSYVSISNRIVDYIGQSAEIIIVDSQNIDSWLTNKYYCVDWKYSLSPTLQCQYLLRYYLLIPYIEYGLQARYNRIVVVTTTMTDGLLTNQPESGLHVSSIHCSCVEIWIVVANIINNKMPDLSSIAASIYQIFYELILTRASSVNQQGCCASCSLYHRPGQETGTKAIIW